MTWLREKVAKEIEAQLSLGHKPWEPDWDIASARATSIMSPVNPTSGRRYRGGNRIVLGMVAQANGYTDPRWLTMNQANKINASVAKGEKATWVEYWKWSKSVKTDQKDLATGKPVYENVKVDRPSVFYAKVFNAQQMIGMPEIEVVENIIHPHDAADGLILASGAVIEFGMRDVPCYIPAKDLISMPAKASFNDTEGYYATLLHESVHWTKREGRSDRDMGSYAVEELVAELGAAMLCSDLGIAYKMEKHASYIGDWLTHIQSDKNAFYRASAAAEKAAGFLMQFANKPDFQPLDDMDLSDFSFDMDQITSALEESESMVMA